MEREVFYTVDDHGWFCVFIANGDNAELIERHETEAQAQKQCDELS